MIKVIHIDCADWFVRSGILSVYHLLLSRLFSTGLAVVNNLADADVALVGPYGFSHHSKEFRSATNVWKLYITGEPTLPDWRLVHHGLTFCPTTFGQRNHRFPIWMFDICWDPSYPAVLTYEESEYLINTNRSPFLSEPETNIRLNKYVAVFNNPELTRMCVFNVLSKYGLCDGVGRPFGTEQEWAGGNYQAKLNTLRRYSGNMCFENVIQSGYVTEKVFHSKLAGCFTLTWGSNYKSRDFTSDYLIDYETVSELCDEELYTVLKSKIEQHNVIPEMEIFKVPPSLVEVEKFLQQSYVNYKEHGDDLLTMSDLYYPNVPEPPYPRKRYVSNMIRIAKGILRLGGE
jgi:hypothetical protein